ncbi:MAG TPA: sodium-dependent transporter, partial [Microbacterium sp.]|nr:sodium-dependent transporter [Microbacterium sp.]
ILAGIGVFSAIGFLAHQQGVGVDEVEGLTGVALAFMTFPAIVSEMPGGGFMGVLFFGALTLAGLTSLISILEVVIAAIRDKFGLSRLGAVGTIGVLAAISIVLLGTTSGLIALDTIDQWSNNIGIVASAIVTTILVIWVRRRGGELARHLSAVSTFKVGALWVIFTGVVAPVVLFYMVFEKIRDLVTGGYEGYATWYIGVAGWGSIVLALLGAILLPLVTWRNDPERFDEWPSKKQLRLKKGALL